MPSQHSMLARGDDLGLVARTSNPDDSVPDSPACHMLTDATSDRLMHGRERKFFSRDSMIPFFSPCSCSGIKPDV